MTGIRWGKPHQVAGDRVAIDSQCRRFCITKENETYKAMRLTGSIWRTVRITDDLSRAKSAFIGSAQWQLKSEGQHAN